MIISCFIFLSLALSCIANAEPSAEDLLREARLRPTTHPITLAAEIRGAEEPFPLTFKIGKGQIEYQLHNPEETIVLKLGTTNSSLSETKKGITNLVTQEKRYQEIRNTGVTYDDLSLGFLYWPHPRLAGTQQLRGTKASMLELFPPENDRPLSKLAAGNAVLGAAGTQRLSVQKVLDGASTGATTQYTSAVEFSKWSEGPYVSARLWIDQNSGAPLRMEGFDKNGNLLKRFEVISAQKIDGLWTLKEMRIETFDSTTHAVTQRRYLTIHRDSK